MIWILLGIWLFGGSHSPKPFSLPIEQAEARVKQHVSDPARRDQSEQILKQMAAIEAQRGKEIQASIKALQKIADDRAPTPAQFVQLTESEHAKALASRTQMLELRFRLKAQVTRAEWSLVFPAPKAP